MPKASEWSSPIVGFTHSRRHLPHIELPNSCYFTSTTTENRRILSNANRDEVASAIKFHNGSKYNLHAFVVMPDHYHLLLEPLRHSRGGDYSLRQIFHSVNSYSAHQIGGSVWQGENYDHLIRNEKDYFEKLNYIINNPVAEGLVMKADDYHWLWYRGMPEA